MIGRSDKASGVRSRHRSRLSGSQFVYAISLAAALLLGHSIGSQLIPLPAWLAARLATVLPHETQADSRRILYYRHPRSAEYSLEPKVGLDGRSFIPVHAGADVDFEPLVSAAENRQGDSASFRRKVLYYRNPMGLPDTSPTPKKDSMGMDYIPVYEGEDPDDAIIRLTPGKLQRTGVRSEVAAKRVVSQPIRAPGVVQLDERRVTIVATRAETFIEHVENVTTGDRVRKGQPLLNLYSPEISAASAQYLSVLNETGAGGGRALLIESARRRLENLNVPPVALVEIERTRKVPLSVTWTAPRDGVILERNAVEGMRAPPGDVLFRIADLDVVWVLADIAERDLGRVKLSQSAQVRLRGQPPASYNARVTMIYPLINKATRTGRVRIELPNDNGALRPDMYTDVTLATGTATPVVAVPENSIVDNGERQVVIVDLGGGRFDPREVKIGAQGDGYVEIVSGVTEGEAVVTAANFLIDAESNLKSALQAMTAPASEAAK